MVVSTPLKTAAKEPKLNLYWWTFIPELSNFPKIFVNIFVSFLVLYSLKEWEGEILQHFALAYHEQYKVGKPAENKGSNDHSKLSGSFLLSGENVSLVFISVLSSRPLPGPDVGQPRSQTGSGHLQSSPLSLVGSRRDTVLWLDTEATVLLGASGQNARYLGPRVRGFGCLKLCLYDITELASATVSRQISSLRVDHSGHLEGTRVIYPIVSSAPGMWPHYSQIKRQPWLVD